MGVASGVLPRSSRRTVLYFPTHHHRRDAYYHPRSWARRSAHTTTKFKTALPFASQDATPCHGACTPTPPV